MTMPRRMALGALTAWVLVPAVAVLWGIPPVPLLALFSATLLIEYGAVAVGVGLGLPSAFLLVFITTVSLAIIFTLFAVFDALAASSARVCGFLERAQHRHGSSRMLQKYGMLSLVPLVIVIGFYFSPPVAWFMGWERRRSLILLAVGEIIGELLVLATALGIMRVIGPG